VDAYSDTHTHTHTHFRCVLTYAASSQQPVGGVWSDAGGEDGLHHVVGERDGDDGLAGRLDDQQRRPQADEGQETPEGLQDVGVGGPRLGDGGPQLGVAQGPEHGEDPSDGPHHQGEAVRGAVDEDALGRDEDPRADHVPHDQADPVQEGDLLLQLHGLPWALRCLRWGATIVLLLCSGGAVGRHCLKKK